MAFAITFLMIESLL